jgi:hypothetical protein
MTDSSTMLKQLLQLGFYPEAGSCSWSFKEGITMRDIDKELDNDLREFCRKHALKSYRRSHSSINAGPG